MSDYDTLEEGTIIEEFPQDESLESLLEQAEKERDDFKEQLLRSLAEFQNYRKRMQTEQANIRAYATESLVADLLPVLDNFDRSLASLESGASAESVLEGVKMVDRQLRQVLESQKVVKLHPHGEAFDPEKHEAIAVESTDEHPEDTVVHVLEAGYMLGDKVIRPARVKVAKKP